MEESSSPSLRMDSDLAAMQLLSTLEPEIVQAIASRVEQLALAADEWLFQQGDPSDALYVVLEGTLVLKAVAEEAVKNALTQIGSGELIGEMEIFSGKPRTTSLQALTPVTLAKLSKAAFEDIAKAHPKFLEWVGEIVEKQLGRKQLYEVLPKLFGPLDMDTMQQIESRLEWLFLPRGDVLMRQGDPVRDFYVVINGRLLATTADAQGQEKVLGDLINGESLGATQILTGANSTVTIHVGRDTSVVKFSQEAFEWLITTYPKILKQISIDISHDLRRVIQGPDADQRTRNLALDIVLVPLTPDVPLAEFAQTLATVLSKTGPTLILDTQSLDDALNIPGISQTPEGDPENIRLVAWMNEQETKYAFTLYEANVENTPWTRRSLRQADHIVFIGRASGSSDLSEVETAVLQEYNKTISVPQSLVLLYEPGQEPHQTRRWLEPRQVNHHQHFRMRQAADFRRLARLLTGRRVGLVLGGGGARGYAHIGIIHAFKEAGVEIDIVGGTSMGSIIAGQLAMGWDYPTMMQRSKAAMPKSVFDYTLPIAALNSGRRWTKMVTTLFEEVQIEDLWLNYFCVSANLTQAKTVIHDSGSLSEGVRASTSIPGIIPPVLKNGDLLVDGGVLDNLPVAVMKQRNGGGPIIASDVSAPVDLQVTTDFGLHLSGWKLFWQRINPFVKTPDIPSLGATIMRSSLLSSAHALDAAKALADIYIYPPVEAYGTLEFPAMEKIVDIGYAYGKKMIEEWRAAGKLDKFLNQ